MVGWRVLGLYLEVLNFLAVGAKRSFLTHKENLPVPHFFTD